MKKLRLVLVAFALVGSACSENPKPLPIAAASPAAAVAPPIPLATPIVEPAIEPALWSSVQRNLKALGYNSGKPGDMTDPTFRRAILAFESDHGMAEDGDVTPALVQRLEAANAAFLKATAESNRNGLFVYSDGSVRGQPIGLLMAPPDGLVSDAPANFLMPLRPGRQGVYHLSRRAGDDLAVTARTVTCRAGKKAMTKVPLGTMDAIQVDCHSDGSQPLQWSAIYSAKVRTVVRLKDSTGTHDLVAIRPVASDWPSAARMGLDWALTHVLQTAAVLPVQWSSTGVTPHFQIIASGPTVAGRDAGLNGRYSASPCRRFDMIQTGSTPVHYPGIACQEKNGQWALPGSTLPFASPVNAIASGALGPSLRGARN